MTRARDLADSADKDISGTLTVDNIVMSNDMTVADDGKVIFGAGSDLEIYHDGNSKIADVGDGKLEIHSNGTGVFIQKGATEYMGKFETDGAVTLYYDNAAKLATTSTGVDVEGNLIAKGYLASEASNSTNKWLAYTYTDNTFRINYNGAGADEITIQTDGHVLINNTAYGANGTLVVQQTADSKGVAIIDSAAANTFFLENDGTINKVRNNAAVPIAFETSDTERLRIAAAGEMQLGGTTNAGFIDFDGSSLQLNTQRNPNTGAFQNTGRAHTGMQFFDGNGTASNSYIRFFTTSSNNTTATERMRILAGGGLTFNGDTSADNALDDYEIGSWTPRIRDGAGNIIGDSNNVGRYVKVGDLVKASFSVTRSDSGSHTGNLLISGWPFSVNTATNLVLVGGGGIWIDNGVGSDYVSSTVYHNGTYLFGVMDHRIDSGNRYIQATQVNNSRPVYGSYVYRSA